MSRFCPESKRGNEGTKPVFLANFLGQSESAACSIGKVLVRFPVFETGVIVVFYPLTSS